MLTNTLNGEGMGLGLIDSPGYADRVKVNYRQINSASSCRKTATVNLVKDRVSY